MRRALRSLAAGVALALVSFAAGASATTAGSPFYLVPSTTKECQKVAHCRSVPGPWVAVPADGEATFLFGCPVRRGFLVGGTDARASSARVRVWFDGRLGAPIGQPRGTAVQAAVLLFHAATSNGKPGSFQPIVGCVTLTESSKRSTVSARRVAAVPGVSPGAALDLRAEKVELNLATGLTRPSTTIACPGNERLVGSWSALALVTTDPPSPAYARAVRIATRAAGNTVRATFGASRTFGYLAPQAWAQVGAMCEP
jgi:hypothetical protein